MFDDIGIRSKLALALWIMLSELFKSIHSAKNCSFTNQQTSKIIFKICEDEFVCCGTRSNEACCETQTYLTVMPVKLTFRNLIFIAGIFVGIIIIGAIIISVIMLLASIVEKRRRAQFLKQQPIYLEEPDTEIDQYI